MLTSPETAAKSPPMTSSGPMLHLSDMPTQLQDHHRQTQSSAQVESEAAAKMTGQGILTIAELEKQAILETIERLKGDKLLAAKLLGIGKTTLYRKLKEYGLSDGDGVGQADEEDL